MHIDANANSDVGKRRAQNQDSFLIDEQLGLYIVCDGMGGHAAGETASANAVQMTANTVRQCRGAIQQALADSGGHATVVRMAADIVRTTCQQLYQMAVDDRRLAGMGTTLTMLLVVGDNAILAHVGDSRLYLLRRDVLHQLTNDHTMANELIRTGHIAADSPEIERFRHVLMRSVGSHASVDVETLLFQLLPGDRLLLCTDGLSNYFVDDDDVVSILAGDDFQLIPQRLTDLANSRGGDDNITAMVLCASVTPSNPAAEVQATLDALEGTFLCRGLTLNGRMRVANAGHLRRFGANASIVRKGDIRTGMFVVVHGTCEMTKPSGRMVNLAAGDCFGETALARGDRFRIQVRAREPVCLLHIPRDRFRELVQRIPKPGHRLLDNLLNHISCQYDELLNTGEGSSEIGVQVRSKLPADE